MHAGRNVSWSLVDQDAFGGQMMSHQSFSMVEEKEEGSDRFHIPTRIYNWGQASFLRDHLNLRVPPVIPVIATLCK